MHERLVQPESAEFRKLSVLPRPADHRVERTVAHLVLLDVGSHPENVLRPRGSVLHFGVVLRAAVAGQDNDGRVDQSADLLQELDQDVVADVLAATFAAHFRFGEMPSHITHLQMKKGGPEGPPPMCENASRL